MGGRGAPGRAGVVASGGLDNDFPVNVGEILEVIRTAEVLIFRFLIVPQRLLVDPRHSASEGPLVKVVPPAGSAEERFRSLKQLRPSFALPERITVIHWPKLIARLEESGVWAGIERRIAEAGFPQSVTVATQALRELKRLEQREAQRAVQGEGYQTLWERV
jgi:hypothetical protein